jgi:VanZ family protein
MKRIFNILVFVAYGLLVAVVSLQQVDSVSVGNYDKVGHWLFYGLFAVLAFRLQLSRKPYFYVCAAIVAYGCLMEFGQSFVPGRLMSVYDMYANTLGVIMGMGLCEAYVRKRRRGVQQ